MKKTYALFDFDGTLIKGDSILLFMHYAWRNNLCSAKELLRFVAAGALFSVKLIPPKRAKEMGLRFLKGKERAVYSAAAEDFCSSVLVPRLYPQGVEAIQSHLAAGHDVILISASPAFYLEPLKRILNLTEVLGTRFSADEEGRFAGEIIGHNCRGIQKTVRMDEYLAEVGTQLDFDTSSAYGDSAHDLPMLKLCKNTFAINPKKKLRKKLKTLDGITVLYWKEKP